MPIPIVDADGTRRLILDNGDVVIAPETTGTEAQQIGFQAELRNLSRGVQAFFGADREPLRQEALAERELLRGVRAEHPFNMLFGEILPLGLGTGGIGAESSLLKAFASSGTIGAAEGLLDFDPESTDQIGRAAIGAESAIAGDMAGRVLGRVFNAARGFLGKVFKEEAPAAVALREVGGTPTAGQVLDDKRVRGLEASAASDFLTSGALDDINLANQKVSRDALSRAMGFGEDELPESLTAEAFDQIAKRGEAAFGEVGTAVGELGIGEEFAERILSLEQFRKLRGVGGLKKLQQGTIEAGEFQSVRQALSDEMASAFDKGQGPLGLKIRGMIEELDSRAAESIAHSLGPDAAADALQNFAKVREQWRVLRVAEMPNVVTGGQVNPGLLNARLKSNFGTSATRGRADQLTNVETADLLNTASAMGDPRVRPIVGSSGTAERQAIREAVSNPVGAVVRAGAVSPVMRGLQASPAGAQAVAGALDPSPLLFPQLGRLSGIATADEPTSPADVVNLLLLQQFQR